MFKKSSVFILLIGKILDDLKHLVRTQRASSVDNANGESLSQIFGEEDPNHVFLR